MGRPFWLLATEVMVMVKTLGDANSQRRRAREDCNVNGDHLQRKMEWIQGDTERNYSQAEYGKNVLVVGDRGDGENSPAKLIQESEQMSAREDRVD
jgi:hypothetical protein